VCAGQHRYIHHVGVYVRYGMRCAASGTEAACVVESGRMGTGTGCSSSLMVWCGVVWCVRARNGISTRDGSIGCPWARWV